MEPAPIPSPYDTKQAIEENKRHVSIARPMGAWIAILVIAMIIKVVLNQVSILDPSSSAYAALMSLSSLILFTPGDVVLPLVVGAIIGVGVGIKAKGMDKARIGGLLNGVYAAFVYLVVILVIYTIMYYTLPTVVPGFVFLLGLWLVAPVAIVIVLSLLFAILSYSRKVA